MKKLKDYALGYFDRGFDVIPLVPNNKYPLVKFADKTFTRKELEEFWDNEPNCNIGLLTRKFWVVDIDTHGEKNGYQSLKEWEHVRTIPRTSQVLTASGGKHLYFKKPIGFTMPQKVDFLDGVDIKFHVNNYVVAPPSVIDGASYRWDFEKSLENLAFAMATDELVEAIKKTAGIEDKKTQYTGALSRFKSDTPKVSKVTQAVNECLKGLGGEGARNNTVASYTGKLISMGIEKEIVVLLVNVMNDKSPQPLSARELHTTIESMYNTDRRYSKTQ